MKTMNGSARDLLSIRTVAIRLPGGDTEYWLTDQVFSTGDSVRCQGRDWVVVETFDVHRTDDHVVTLGEPPPVGPDVAA